MHWKTKNKLYKTTTLTHNLSHFIERLKFLPSLLSALKLDPNLRVYLIFFWISFFF
jgi:hypothetical protein